MIKEFKTEINKRNTIIRYDDKVDVKELLTQINRYKKANRWKLKQYLIKSNNYIIIDEEYKMFRDNNKSVLYADNQIYEITKTFKLKNKIIKTIERIFYKQDVIEAE